jgi:hopene-associated glycosyltransferase HpnB
MSLLLVASALALAAWLAVLLLPWQPHRIRERLEAGPRAGDDLSDVAVLIPARDEAALIGGTIAALRSQGSGLQVIVVDDESTDGTADVAASAAVATGGHAIDLRLVAGAPLPQGWAGKLWALQQGFRAVDRAFVVLLDADIELAPGMLPTLRRAALERDLGLVSIMAKLRSSTLWERLLAPPFVLFFKLLYPFALANDPSRRTAAAAGGCMLIRTAALSAIGGFAAVRNALIDDCALAAALKRAGERTWLGLSDSVMSRRQYGTLAAFWRMVSRSAFTQLRYSVALLIGTTLAMAIVFAAPLVGLASLLWEQFAVGAIGGLAVAAMAAAYVPIVRFYGLPAGWALTLPIAAVLFLAMTWSSAVNYWRGTRAAWKNRSYES